MSEPSKFRDLGEPYYNGAVVADVPAAHFPCVYLDLDKVPELKGMEPGTTVEIMFKAEVKSIRLDEERSEITLELKKASVHAKEEKNEPKSETNKVKAPTNEADREISKLTGGTYA